MDYFCGPLTLYTRDKIRLIDFLSDVFEFDVDTQSDLISGGTYSLQVVESPNDSIVKSEGISFLFELKNSNELEEIVNKFNFFLYRNIGRPHAFEQINLKKESEISIRDLDGREWKFKSRPAII